MLQMQCEFLDIFSHNIMNNFTSDDMEVTCKVNPQVRMHNRVRPGLKLNLV